VDVTRNPSVQQEYGVGGFPTLKWFVNGKLSRLSVDARSSDGLVTFCKKNTDGGPVTSTERLRTHIKQFPFVAVAYVQNEEGDTFDALSQAEGEMMHLEFVYITTQSIADDMKAKVPSIVFYVANQDATVEHVYDGPLDAQEVEWAVRRLATETVLTLNDDNGDAILQENYTPKVVLFRSQGEISLEHIVLKETADKLKHKYNFMVVKDGTNEKLSRFVGLETHSDPPQPWIYLFQVSKNKRYRFEGEMSVSGLTSFLDAFEAHELSPYLMSEPIPEGVEEDGALVKRVVGKTFREFVNQDKHVIIEFFADFSSQSRALEPRLNLTARYFETRYAGEFAFGRIDGTKNEVGDDSQIQGFPTVWLYPKGKKDPPYPIDLSKESGDVHLLVKSLRLACQKPREERSQEVEYVKAAKRFKAAVRGLKGSMAPAIKHLNAASAELEKLASRKSEL
jgi:protein disulfide-isomerase A1